MELGSRCCVAEKRFQVNCTLKLILNDFAGGSGKCAGSASFDHRPTASFIFDHFKLRGRFCTHDLPIYVANDDDDGGRRGKKDTRRAILLELQLEKSIWHFRCEWAAVRRVNELISGRKLHSFISAANLYLLENSANNLSAARRSVKLFRAHAIDEKWNRSDAIHLRGATANPWGKLDFIVSSQLVNNEYSTFGVASNWIRANETLISFHLTLSFGEHVQTGQLRRAPGRQRPHFGHFGWLN